MILVKENDISVLSRLIYSFKKGSAAYSVKRNYVRLGLLAYECRFDRAGLDPRSVIELSEMPHAVGFFFCHLINGFFSCYNFRLKRENVEITH